MNNMKYFPVYLFVIFIFNITTISTENKTSSECWACTPNTSHVLNCTGAGVIVIQSAHYAYKSACASGITRGGGCGGIEINRCCKPGVGAGSDCFKSFNVTDRKELETTCSNKSICTFNGIRHDQPDNCNLGIKNNSFTLINYTCQPIENKTSSECWACSSHVLNCTGAGVIVIQSAAYGYKTGCSNGIGSGVCVGGETNRCCKPGGPGRDCFKSFNVRDREELETTCSSKSTCTFNSIRHDQPVNCFSSINNSFTLINYICQTSVTSLPTLSSSTNNQADTTSLDVKTSERPPPSKERKSSDDKITSGEIGGIVVGVVAIVILLFIAAFLLYQRHEMTKLTRNHQLEQNHQQSTTRTVSVQYSETDFNDITAQSNIAASSSVVNTSYSQLNRLGSESIKYDDLIMNNGQRNAITDNNSNGYYNQQYVNM